MYTQFTAIEIMSPEIADIAIAINPDFKKLDYDKDMHRNFLVFGFPEAGTCIILNPENFGKYFQYIENGKQITLKNFIQILPKQEIKVVDLS